MGWDKGVPPQVGSLSQLPAISLQRSGQRPPLRPFSSWFLRVNQPSLQAWAHIKGDVGARKGLGVPYVSGRCTPGCTESITGACSEGSGLLCTPSPRHPVPQVPEHGDPVQGKQMGSRPSIHEPGGHHMSQIRLLPPAHPPPPQHPPTPTSGSNPGKNCRQLRPLLATPRALLEQTPATKKPAGVFARATAPVS